jgi:hypothetical protein
VKQIFFETNIFLKQVLESKTQTLDTTGDITIGNFTEKLKSKFLWKIYDRKLLLVYFYLFLILLKLNKTDGSRLNTVIKQLFYSFLIFLNVSWDFFSVCCCSGHTCKWSHTDPNHKMNSFESVLFKKTEKTINIFSRLF